MSRDIADFQPLTGEELARIRQLLADYTRPPAAFHLDPITISSPVFPRPAYLLAALLIGFIGEELGKVTKEEVHEAAKTFYKEYFPAALKPLISLGAFQAWTWLAFCWLRDNLTVPEKRAEIAILAIGLSLTPARRGRKNVG